MIGDLFKLGNWLTKTLDEKRGDQIFKTQLSFFHIEKDLLPSTLKWDIKNICESEITYIAAARRMANIFFDIDREVIRPVYEKAANVVACCMLGDSIYDIKRSTLQIRAATSDEIVSRIVEGVRHPNFDRGPVLETLLYQRMLEAYRVNKEFAEFIEKQITDGLPEGYIELINPTDDSGG